MSAVRFLIDLTTSREYKGQNPVGIVRTEREIAKAFMSRKLEVDFFWFDTKAGGFKSISRREAEEIVGYSTTDDFHRSDTTKTAQIVQFKTGDTLEIRRFLQSVRERLTENQSKPADVLTDKGWRRKFELYSDDVVISAGLLWDGNYLSALYKLKQVRKFRFIQVVYDIVPIVMPEYCVPGMNVRFPRFILDVSWTADAVYCISDSTLTDLENYIITRKLPKPLLKRMTLGADLDVKPLHESSGNRMKLTPGEFVVYVSTIEPRKNHFMLFNAWRQIFLTNPHDLVTLVIVGRHGWNATDLINMIQSADYLYPDYIRIFTEVSDADLDWLYINSRFSIYPSLYEGWGLPVAESLIRGKFCIASSTSSLPEVACGLAHLIDPLDLPQWVATLHHYMVDHDDLAAKERAIRDTYKPMPWDTVMSEFVDSVCETVGSDKREVLASSGVL